MHDFRVALFLAFTSIVRGYRSTLVLMLAILSLTFVNALFVAGMLNGMTEAIYRQVIENFTSHLVIEPQEAPVKKTVIARDQELRRQIGRIPGVLATARHYRLPATVAYDKEQHGRPKFVSAEIVGIDPDDERRVTGVARSLLGGHYLDKGDTSDIVLGAELAGGYGGLQELTSLGGARVGDKVTVAFSSGVTRTYRVKGVYRVRFGFVDRLAFITAKEAESILSTHNSASQVLVKIDTRRRAEGVYVRQIGAIAPNLVVRRWVDLMGPFTNVAQALGAITLMVTAVSLAVAAATIFMVIYVNAVNRRRQIGILKAIGIKQTVIVYAYMLQALFLSICGIVMGSAVTLWMLDPFFAAHPLRLPMGDTALVLDVMFVVYSAASLVIAGGLAGLIPAWRVARENILQAIWAV